MTLSVVVPVYNSAQTLRPLVERLDATLQRLTLAYEILLVNDGSADGSWHEIEALAAERPWLSGIDLARNSGQHNALLAGIRAASGEVIVTLDDDLQNPPEEIPKLLQALDDQDVDVVYGVPHTLEHERWRNLSSLVIKWTLAVLMGARTAKNVSAFRAFRTEVRDAFSEYRGSLVSIDVLLTWGTSRFGALAVAHQPRAAGRSNYSVWKLTTHALNMLTGFSAVPLQIASYVGFGFTLFGLLVLAFVVGRYLVIGGGVPGFPFLASLIAIFAGAQMFALGILGEYLARVHFRTMDKPSYTVRRTVSRADSRVR
jgi:glycosyltransferase involved in cell wall biosynthesis